MNTCWTSKRSYKLPLESTDPQPVKQTFGCKSINYRSKVRGTFPKWNLIFQLVGGDEVFIFFLPVSELRFVVFRRKVKCFASSKIRCLFCASEINGNIHHDCDIFHLLDPGDLGRCPAFATCFVDQQNYQFFAASLVLETNIKPANSSINHHLWWSIFTTSLPKMCWNI